MQQPGRGSSSRSLTWTSTPGKSRPYAIPTHDNVLQDITAQHVLMTPSRQEAEMVVPNHLLAEGVQNELTLTDLASYF